MFMFEVFNGAGTIWLAFICSLVLNDIFNCIKLTFCKKEKPTQTSITTSILTFSKIHDEYWKKNSELQTHDEKKQLVKTTFDDFMKVVNSKIEFDINEPDEHNLLLIEYVLTMYDSLEYVKKLIDEMGADPTKTGRCDIPMISWIAKMSNIEAYNYFLDKNYHNVTVLPKYNIFSQCVCSSSSTLQQKHDFLKMLKDTNRKLDVDELYSYFGYPLITFFALNIATNTNLKNNYQLVINTIKIILSFGVDIDEKNKDGFTELMMCVKNNLYNKTKLFVELGADLYAIDNNELCAFAIASQSDHFTIHRYLTNIMFLDLAHKINKLEQENVELKSKFSGTIIEC